VNPYELFPQSIEEKVLTVSEYNALVNEAVNSLSVKIKGEITELNIWQNKFAYITIKDTEVDNITTSIFGIAAILYNLHEIKIGDIVIISGYPGIHNKTGKHSIQVQKIEKLDEGYYIKKRELLIKQLTEEGIIDENRKRRIKKFNNKIALITAVPSQAYNDFIKIYGSRWGQGQIDVYKAKMQGSDADKIVTSALEVIYCSDIQYDCIVIARGGGSKEDLINFDSEILARKIFASPFPVISAIGHEGDISISDMVADIRASTPSNAAEIVTAFDKTTISSTTQYRLESIFNRVVYNLENTDNLVNDLYSNIKAALINNISNIETKIENKNRIFKAYDISTTLNRGFSIITNQEDAIVSNHEEISENKIYNIYLKNEKRQTYKFIRTN
jgi:exodeoxyribonuclease VII large subunit